MPSYRSTNPFYWQALQTRPKWRRHFRQRKMDDVGVDWANGVGFDCGPTSAAVLGRDQSAEDAAPDGQPFRFPVAAAGFVVAGRRPRILAPRPTQRSGSRPGHCELLET